MKAEKVASEERLARFLSSAGIASRRQAEELIREGRVTLNGNAVRDPGTNVDPKKDAVKVDGKRVKPSAPVYLLLHKPRNVLCTMEDPRGRPCVGDLLLSVKGKPYPVGRLDFDAEGLLLCTNDGEMANRVIHPRYHVKKVYHVKVKGFPDEKVIDRLRSGVPLDGKKTAPAGVSFLKRGKKNSWLRMILYEGRNRQVKRMLDLFRYQVLKLRRVALGPLTLEGLPPGAYRNLRPDELKKLQAAVEIAEARAATSGVDKRKRRL
ncbi:MAG: pseudouridine synthase [Thermodesulfobacteriota bacterium]